MEIVATGGAAAGGMVLSVYQYVESVKESYVRIVFMMMSLEKICKLK